MPGNPIASFAPPGIVIDGPTQIIDCMSGSYFTWLIGASRTVSTFLNPIGGQFVRMEIVQDTVGSRVLTWPSNVSWPGGVAPTLSNTPGAVDVVRFEWNPTASKWRGVLGGLAFA